MKKIAVLILAFSLCLSCSGSDQNNDEAYQVAGSASCGNICPLMFVTQKLGELGEKVVNMAEKITFLETRLQNAEKEVLELKNLTGGSPQVAFSAALRDSGSGNIGPFTTATPLKYKKNSERLTSVWDTSGSDINDMGSNAVVIPLKVGDNVFVQLEPNRLVYNDSMNYNTFSGFLLFTM
uniref:C1q domain-containing protein n=1 Tax=Poecilia latipinna TaxID=48699 RepID=A0A3B3W2P4_9TELE